MELIAAASSQGSQGSAGAAIGCIGLAGFPHTCWLYLPRAGATQTFVLATLVWLTLAVGVWLLRKNVCCTVDHAFQWNFAAEVPDAPTSVRHNPHLRAEHVVIAENHIVHPSDLAHRGQAQRHPQFRGDSPVEIETLRTGHVYLLSPIATDPYSTMNVQNARSMNPNQDQPPARAAESFPNWDRFPSPRDMQWRQVLRCPEPRPRREEKPRNETPFSAPGIEKSPWARSVPPPIDSTASSSVPHATITVLEDRPKRPVRDKPTLLGTLGVHNFLALAVVHRRFEISRRVQGASHRPGLSRSLASTSPQTKS